jgi:putative transcriptional regulator
MVDIKPGVYGKEDVKRVRGLLNVSQAVFAQVLGVEVNTVSSWEQGVRGPSPIACRFMDEIAHDPLRWRKRLIDAVTWKVSKPEGKRKS